MKRVLIFGILLMSSLTGFSQKTDNLFPLNTEGEIFYSQVVEIEGASKSDLFLSASRWFTDSFVSSNDVIQLSDKESGTIIGKGNYSLPDGRANFTVKIRVKDGKYKYEFYNFKYTPSSSKVKTHGDLSKVKPGGGMLRMWGSVWRKARTLTASKTKDMIKSLEKNMKETSAQDNW